MHSQACVVGENSQNGVSPWLCKLNLGESIYRFPKLFAVLHLNLHFATDFDKFWHPIINEVCALKHFCFIFHQGTFMYLKNSKLGENANVRLPHKILEDRF